MMGILTSAFLYAGIALCTVLFGSILYLFILVKWFNEPTIESQTRIGDLLEFMFNWGRLTLAVVFLGLFIFVLGGR